MRKSLSPAGACCFVALLLLAGCGTELEQAERGDAPSQHGGAQPVANARSSVDSSTSWVYPRDDQMNIRLATVYGRGDLVREHIEQGVSPDEAYEENGETPLMIAARMGHRCLIGDLLDAGADPNATTHNGGTALMRAAGGGHLSVVERLLTAGADPNATAGKGHSALFTATVGERRPDVVDALLEAGADPNVETANGWTPLRSAEHESNEQIAARLREAGATR